MPRLPDWLLSTVFYVYPSEQDAKDGIESGATGFFFMESSKINYEKGVLYAVTNRHVVFRQGIENPILRVNTTDKNFDIIKTSRDNWVGHPDGDDIAICLLPLDSRHHEYDYFERKYVANDEFMKEHNIGPGDDIVMVGRFHVHAGRKRNLPTLRFGNISAMNDEPLYNPFTQLKQESYIVEMRSMSGYSGSPVIVYIPPMSFRWSVKDGEANPLETTFYKKLLGINWGHIQHEAKAKDSDGNPIVIKMDSSMAGVVPISKLMDLIDSEEMVNLRKQMDEMLEKQTKESSGSIDSHEEDGKQKTETG